MHEKTTDSVQQRQVTAADLEALRRVMEDGFDRLALRMDHMVGKHDYATAGGCPSCPPAR